MKKLRFFFRRRLTLADFSEAQQAFVSDLCHRSGVDPSVISFSRTFNNVIFGSGFDFIGFFPVFFSSELCYSYFSESNEID